MRTIISTTFVFTVITVVLFFSCTQTPTDPPPDPPISPVDELTITSLSPAIGKVLSLDTINGKGFSTTNTQNEVSYNGNAAEIISSSPTQLIVRVPATATTGPVSVKVNGNTVHGPVYTILANIFITSISPNSGYAGTQITINGTGFSTVKVEDTVWVNGVKAPVLAAYTNKLIINVPLNSTTGRVDVAVRKDFAAGPVFTYLNGGNDSVIVTTFAGSGFPDTLNGSASTACFGFMWDIASDDGGNLYVADAGYNLVRKVTPAGAVSTLAGAGSQSASYGQGTKFYFPETVTVDNSTGKVYVMDKGLPPIKAITGPETVASLPGSNFFIPTSNPRYGLASDDNGNLYIAYAYYNGIWKLTASGTLSLFAGGLWGDQDGTGPAAKFSSPTAVAIDHRNGTLYISDWGNHRIKKITPDGVVTTLAGAGNPSIGGAKDGWGTNAVFATPYGLAVDDKGNVFVADQGHNMIRKITPDGYVSTVAGTGDAGLINGLGKTAKFNAPMGLAFDKQGNLYVADGLNYVIRKIEFKK